MGNMGNLPLVLVYTTCESTTQDRGGAPGLFGTYEECYDKVRRGNLGCGWGHRARAPLMMTLGLPAAAAHGRA